MKNLVLFGVGAAAAVLAINHATASPFVVSDPTEDTRPTECGYLLDGGVRKSVPVVLVNGKPACKIDVSTVNPGVHTITATFAYTDPVWGFQESPNSSPLGFTRPGALPAPSPLGLTK